MLDWWISVCNLLVVVTLLLTTLPGESPLKKQFVRSGAARYVKAFYTWLMVIATILLMITTSQWMINVFLSYLPASWVSSHDSENAYDSGMVMHGNDHNDENGNNDSNDDYIVTGDKWFVDLIYNYLFINVFDFSQNNTKKLSEEDINFILKFRIQNLLTFLVICVPCRYILSLISVNQSLFFFSTKKQSRKNRKRMLTTFELFEKKVTSHILQSWTALPSEFMIFTRLFQLFTEIKIHKPYNVRRDQPALIITNHALGHGFDVPMMVYNLFHYCGVLPRVLVSPSHFNIPLWSSLIYRLGGAPRTRESCETLMAKGETILVYASRREYNARDNSSNMVWDNKRKLYLDLVHKYNYVVIPAVCVSNEDVLEIVYNISSKDSTNIATSLANRFSKRSSYDSNHDSDGNNNDNNNNNNNNNSVYSPGGISYVKRRSHTKEQQRFQSFKTLTQPLFGKKIVNESIWERKLYHLHFGEPIYVPYDEVKYELMKNYRNNHELVVVSSKAILNSDDAHKIKKHKNSNNQSNTKMPNINKTKSYYNYSGHGGAGAGVSTNTKKKRHVGTARHTHIGNIANPSQQVQNVVENIMNQRRRESRDSRDSRESHDSLPYKAESTRAVTHHNGNSGGSASSASSNGSNDTTRFMFDEKTIVNESAEVSEDDDNFGAPRPNRAQSVRHPTGKTPRQGKNGPQLNRRWSRELEIRLKNAVEEAMTDGIVSMYKEIRKAPDLSLMKTVQDKLKHLTKNNGAGVSNITSYLESSDDDDDSSESSDQRQTNNDDINNDENDVNDANDVKVEKWMD